MTDSGGRRGLRRGPERSPVTVPGAAQSVRGHLIASQPWAAALGSPRLGRVERGGRRDASLPNTLPRRMRLRLSTARQRASIQVLEEEPRKRERLKPFPRGF